MSDDLPQAGPPETGGTSRGRKRTWLVCCCMGCSVAFLAFVVAGLLYFSLLPAFLRELFLAR